MATFADNSVANFFFHSPWRPKWSQLGALQDTKLGDVVVSSKLSTEEFTTPVRRNIGNLNLFVTEGWKPPLKDPVGEETVQVHRDSEIFSGSQFITKQRRMSQSHVIAVEREGEGKLIIIILLL